MEVLWKTNLIFFEGCKQDPHSNWRNSTDYNDAPDSIRCDPACLWAPILGAYELVALLLAIVIGFTIPKVSLDKGHVIMEFLLEKLSSNGKAIMITFTRLLCIGLFAIVSYNLFSLQKNSTYQERFHPHSKYLFTP